jgi:hypothetical protein
MPDYDVPKDGDFASYLEMAAKKKEPAPAQSDASPKGFESLKSAEGAQTRQTIQQVLVEGQEPTDEFLEEWNALNEMPELSDEELERQALHDSGADGDIRTPE